VNFRQHAGSVAAAFILCITGAQGVADAQTAPDYRWSVDFGIGFDNSISGNINSGAIGTLNNQAVVITKNRYEDVYGTGLHFTFGGGYALDELSEVRATFTYQSLDADLTRMGDIGTSNLYGQYGDYKSLGLDFGYRRYAPERWENLRLYAEGTAGLAFISEIDVQLAAPQANLVQTATDFYDRTGAFTLGLNGGVLYQVTERQDITAQIGLRYVTGLSAVDNLAGTGLQSINDSSSRWTMPFVIGLRTRF
jgi:hypothetical protein